MVIFPAKATNNPHGLRMRLTIGVRSRLGEKARRGKEKCDSMVLHVFEKYQLLRCGCGVMLCDVV